MRGFLVSGMASGVGKTTVALAVMATLGERGLAVQPFKCGPDFLDAGHHTRVAGRVARNLPFSVQMTDGLVDFGYVTVEFAADCLLGPEGTVVRGHSFHYSRISAEEQIEKPYRVRYSIRKRDKLEGYKQGNVLASYIHIHFRANPLIAENLVAAIHQVRARQAVSA